MKTLHLLLAASAALLLSACGGSSSSSAVSPEGIGPVRLGAAITDLPRQCDGLYDTIDLEHYDGYYDDMNGEEVPAGDIFLFKKEGITLFQTSIPENDRRIKWLYVLSPELSYKGVHVGMSIAEAMKAGARFYSAGDFASCGFYSCFKVDDSGIAFDYENNEMGEDAFSPAGNRKLDELPVEAGYSDMTADDFAPQTVISAIRIEERIE